MRIKGKKNVETMSYDKVSPAVRNRFLDHYSSSVFHLLKSITAVLQIILNRNFYRDLRPLI